jgi:hypothetical protein
MNLVQRHERPAGQREGAADVEALVVEGGTVQQGLDGVGQLVATSGPARDLGLQRRVGRVVRGVAGERGRGDLQAIERQRPERRVDLLVDVRQLECCTTIAVSVPLRLTEVSSPP